MRILLAPVTTVLLVHAAAAHTLECPTAAPTAWHVGDSRLAGVEVLSAPAGSAIDETAPPSLVPDEQSLRDGTLRQTWVMNGDGPGWTYFVDCHYAGSDRVLRLDAHAVKRCERTITHFSKAAGVGKQSEEHMACD
jgi:hypothetical protein